MQIYKVGGAVRDRLLGRPVSDVDWLVVGATVEKMQALGYRPVGADFPVFIDPKSGQEYALARTERKSGRGYGGFVFHASPDVTLEQDLIRRDLTINAMAEDQQGNLYDPYFGKKDLDQRILRHVSPAFAEDPLRVLRVARFAARYAPLGFRVAPETLELMRQISASGELQALTAERSWKEIERALMEEQPQVFIQVLRDCDALRELMPELDALFAAPQDAGMHTLAALEQAAKHQQPLNVRWACLTQALGTAINAVNQRFKAPRECQELALLVGEFQAHCHRAQQLDAATLLDLLQKFDVYRRPQRFEDFIAACEMDARGRGGEDYPQGDYLRGAVAAAKAVEVKSLVAQGLTGQALGAALKAERLKALEAYTQSAIAQRN
ncbi:tRNA nucleotidyltransferase (CCA-adding enzyme) [Pseudomonas hunanensis]|uniref:tRNA nucleotidyltransferase (CCA-adding enzyme) n=1 Tax=Pseudomonas hunanensis TaxID=1247546 RepID=A0ACC6K4L0_9PSED|nr:multifunctional CCA addition/repair protein [Pseudomonas hunanensis]MDR6713351.1 tRNA nucleotidyltransferase (CCA-adding enzyme) [Pseudomonas hunanensis]